MLLHIQLELLITQYTTKIAHTVAAKRLTLRAVSYKNNLLSYHSQ